MEKPYRETPYFLFKKSRLEENLKLYSKRDFKLYYSVKSCIFEKLIESIAPFIDGISVTSKEHLYHVREEENKKHIHFISPMIRNQEVSEINKYGNSVSFNSFEQFVRIHEQLEHHVKKFIRINPEKSFLQDDRYNPCRKESKLGIPLSEFTDKLGTLSNKDIKEIHGLHFHNNYQSENPQDLEKTVQKIEKTLTNFLPNINFMNIGGGYLPTKGLINSVNNISKNLKEQYEIQIVMEPSFCHIQ